MFFWGSALCRSLPSTAVLGALCRRPRRVSGGSSGKVSRGWCTWHTPQRSAELDQGRRGNGGAEHGKSQTHDKCFIRWRQAAKQPKPRRRVGGGMRQWWPSSGPLRARWIPLSHGTCVVSPGRSPECPGMFHHSSAWEAWFLQESVNLSSGSRADKERAESSHRKINTSVQKYAKLQLYRKLKSPVNNLVAF